MSRRSTITVLLLILLSIPSTSFSQKNTAQAIALQEVFKDDKVIASSQQTIFSFQIQGEDLAVREEEEIQMMALQPNVSGSREIFYHDQKEIESAKFTSGNARASARTCGNYEVEDIFYSDARFCSYPYRFSYSGDEITFKSDLRYSDARYFTKVIFHDELAVQQRTITVKVPTDVNVELIEKNFDGFGISKTVSLQSNVKVITYTAQNLKALKSEANSLGILYYFPHIVVVTKDFSAKGGRKKVIGSPGDLYDWYSSIAGQVENNPDALAADVQRLIADAKTPEDKIKNIYYWVQDNIKYIAFEDGISGFKPEAAQNVLTNRYGDCKGMANLTKVMLKTAGFDARLAWIGTNRIPYTHELPSLAVDNHMICVVYVGDKEYILDATEKFIALGEHGERIQGKDMMIESGDKFIIRKVPVLNADQNLVVRKEEISLDGEVLKGKGQISVQGEARRDILYVSTNIKQENQKKLFDYLAVSDYSNSDEVRVVNTPEVDRDKQLQMEYTYSLENKVTAFDKDLYIAIDWDKKFENMKMDSARMSDYYFHRKIKDRVVKSFRIPAGYKVTHLPSTVRKTHNDFSFEVAYEQKNGILTYTNEIVVTKGVVRKGDFQTWNQFIKELTESYHDQIVLTKIK